MERSRQNQTITHDAGGPVPRDVEGEILDAVIQQTNDRYANADPIEFATKLGPAFARCKWFGCATEEDGIIVALTCRLEGITPLKYHQTYHTIMGKPTKKANAMLIDFRKAGGRYEVHQYDADASDVTFTFEGKSTRIKLDWKTCEESRWPWKDWTDHSKGLKDNWSSSLDRQAMLWSRLVSDTLRRICPEVTEGIYTPEEMMDVEQTPSTQPRKSSDLYLGPVDAIKAPTESEGLPPIRNDSEPVPQPNALNVIQSGVLRRLFKEADLGPAEVLSVLQKRGAKSIDDLSTEQADELIEKLTAKLQSGN